MYKHGQGAKHPCNASPHLPIQSGDIRRKKGVEDTRSDSIDCSCHILLLHVIGPSCQALPNEQLGTISVPFAYEPFNAASNNSAPDPTMTARKSGHIGASPEALHPHVHGPRSVLQQREFCHWQLPDEEVSYHHGQ